MAGIPFLFGTRIGIGKIGSKKGPELEILQNSLEFCSEFPTKDKDNNFDVDEFEMAKFTWKEDWTLVNQKKNIQRT